LKLESSIGMEMIALSTTDQSLQSHRDMPVAVCARCLKFHPCFACQAAEPLAHGVGQDGAENAA
jgi:hypothetical protein